MAPRLFIFLSESTVEFGRPGVYIIYTYHKYVDKHVRMFIKKSGAAMLDLCLDQYDLGSYKAKRLNMWNSERTGGWRIQYGRVSHSIVQNPRKAKGLMRLK